MAKQQQQSINLIDIFSEFKELKNIDRQTFINVLEDSFRNVITKMYGTDANYDVIINPDKGDLEIYRNRLVMEDTMRSSSITSSRCFCSSLRLRCSVAVSRLLLRRIYTTSFTHSITTNGLWFTTLGDNYPRLDFH